MNNCKELFSFYPFNNVPAIEQIVKQLVNQIDRHLSENNEPKDKYCTALRAIVSFKQSIGLKDEQTLTRDFDKLMTNWYHRLSSQNPNVSYFANVWNEINKRWRSLRILLKYITVDEATHFNILNIPLKAFPHGKYDDMINELTLLLQTGVISFPWIKLYSKTKPEIAIDVLRKHQPHLSTKFTQPHNIRFSAKHIDGSQLLSLHFDGKTQAIIHSSDEYNNFDVLVDLFQEKQRLSARREDQTLCPLERWATEPELIRTLINNSLRKYKQVNMKSLRDGLYSNVRECTSFKSSLVVSLVQILGGTSMLDFSAGWGDRLIGAIGAGLERYQGYDPNGNLKPGHDAILSAFLSVEEREHFTINYIGFEDAPIEPDAFDLVFTSPPFFNFEHYTDLPGQSIELYPQLNEWLVHFLHASIVKSWQSLRVGGHLVIHITDVYKTCVCESMLLLALWKLENVKYRGVICSTGDAGRARPMWIFQKTPNNNIETANQAKNELQRLYPSIYELV